MPQGFELRACWTATTRGNVVASARDDDIDYTMLALHVMETYGRGYTTADVAREWLDRLPYTQTYTAERAAYRNLINELDIPAVGAMNNPYREWVGAQIRADVYGYVNPGDPRSAATLAYQDAVLSHRANGIYGEMWAAALVAAAFTADGARAAVVESLRHIPPTSRLHEALTGVLALHERGHTWESARQTIGEQLGHYNWVHTIPNAALVTAGVLWGGGDFTQTIALTVTGGWDTDSNGATAGSVAGILTGANRIPAQWIAPLNDTVRSSLAGFDGVRISDLASRTHALTRG
jgi:ADP-ribosylglycohydrolase